MSYNSLLPRAFDAAYPPGEGQWQALTDIRALKPWFCLGGPWERAVPANGAPRDRPTTIILLSMAGPPP